MKGQYRTTQHCPLQELPENFEALIDGVVYEFARNAFQPTPKADNQVLYNVFVEDGLRERLQRSGGTEA